jgi:hypothetical protein
MLVALNFLVMCAVLAILIGRIGRMTPHTNGRVRLAYLGLAIGVAWSGLAPIWDERGLQWADVAILGMLGMFIQLDRRRHVDDHQEARR